MWLEHHKKTFRLPKLLQSLSLFKSQEGRIKKLKPLISKIWNERFQSFYRWWLSLESQFASWERPYSSKLKNCAFIRILFSKVILQVFDKMTCVSRTFSRWKSKFAKLWKTIFWTTTSFVWRNCKESSWNWIDWWIFWEMKINTFFVDLIDLLFQSFITLLIEPF